MGPPLVVEVDVAAERSSRLADAVVGLQIHLLVFDAAPEALEEHVVAPRAPAVHADRNLVLDQDVGEGVTRESTGPEIISSNTLAASQLTCSRRRSLKAKSFPKFSSTREALSKSRRSMRPKSSPVPCPAAMRFRGLRMPCGVKDST